MMNYLVNISTDPKAEMATHGHPSRRRLIRKPPIINQSLVDMR